MKKNIKSLAIFLIPVALTLPIIVLAEEVFENNYIGLIKIPVESDTFGGYINALYLLAVSLAAILAVLKLILAGVKYMLSDVVTNKSDAKSEIKGALVGLLIIIAAVVVLNEINPSITDNDVGFPEKVKNVKFEIRNPGITKTTTGETVEEVHNDLTNGIPECAEASLPNRSANNALIMSTTLDVSKCAAEDRMRLLQEFETKCEGREGSKAISGGTGSNIVKCETPLESTEEWSVDGYGSGDCNISLGVISFGCDGIDLSDKYVIREGNMIRYDAAKACATDYAHISNQEDCIEEMRDAFVGDDDWATVEGWARNEWCPNQGGRVESREALICEVPAAKMGDAEAREAESMGLFEGKDVTDYDDMEEICIKYFESKGKKAQIIDTEVTWSRWGNSDYACVVYDSEN